MATDGRRESRGEKRRGHRAAATHVLEPIPAGKPSSGDAQRKPSVARTRVEEERKYLQQVERVRDIIIKITGMPISRANRMARRAVVR